MSSLYETDFYAWCYDQAERLKRLHDGGGDLDIYNIIEEIESMGRREKGKLTSLLNIIFLHLLKYIYEPERRSRSWIISIGSHRDKVQLHLEDNPSLKHSKSACAEKAYQMARKEASYQTDLPLSTFPVEMPFTLNQALDENWMPQD